MRSISLILCLFVSVLGFAQGPNAFSRGDIDAIYPSIEALYLDLHRNPELSSHEVITAAKLADAARKLGFEVTTNVGGTGVVAILRNGGGPTVMVRTELDALPVAEATGLPYASQVRTKDSAGNEVAVMHACGHDVHMSTWVASATLLSQHRDLWHGTLMMIAQPAEETLGGAAGMLKDGLFTRFPKPDFALAVHDDDGIPAGQVGLTSGYSLAASDSVDLTIYGRGGHGAKPQMTVDPIVIAARTIVALQTIVSRETDPNDPAVITVGSIHGGTKHNIIPDEVRLQLTVRSYREEVRQHLLSAIERVARAEAEAAGAPQAPEMKVVDSTHAVFNDPALTRRIEAALRRTLGDANVLEIRPKMVSEDFSEYGRAGLPTLIIHVGAVNPQKYRAAKASGEPLPSLHSSRFFPDREPTIKTAILTETSAVLELMGTRH
ncbi:MAG TPA: amidohydrolase [Terriglobales bacterium]|nr:amidohydrolase [Terriglobales bacterium]